MSPPSQLGPAASSDVGNKETVAVSAKPKPFRSRRRAQGAPAKPQPRSNPSVEARPNGVAPGPRGAQAYHAPRGPGAMPSAPPHLER